MTEYPRDHEPARLLWLQPPFLHPPSKITRRQERVFLLVGIAALFAGYNQSAFGFALPQIQASLHIAEDQVGPTAMWFRLAVLGAMALAMLADVLGRRTLLLYTIAGQAIATLGSALAPTYAVFVACQIATNVFCGAEMSLCFVVIVEEMSAPLRGWSVGTLAAMQNFGGGVMAIAFAFVNVLPYGWRSLYAIGAVPLFVVAFLRRRLPETERFEVREAEVRKLASHFAATIEILRRLVSEHPRRVLAIGLAGLFWAFAGAPAGALSIKYLQQTLGYAPWQTTLIVVPGGFFALMFNILVGRLSDRVGRKTVIVTGALLYAVVFAVYFSGLRGPFMPALWAASFFFGLTTDTLLSGLSVEIFPTAYRATVGGLGSLFAALGAAIGLTLEGRFYDVLGGHGPAASVMLPGVLAMVAAVAFLPEPAGKVLEEVSEPSMPAARRGEISVD
jgi:putative MFS transporter